MRGQYRILASGAALLIALLPFETAFAQNAGAYDRQGNVSVRDRPRPDYDPLGLRFGGFDAKASVGVDVESNDNAFAAETTEDSDIITATSENATLASHWSRHSLAFSAGADQTFHQDFGGDDTQDDYIRADGRLDIYRSTEAGAGIGLADDHEARDNPDAPNNVSEPVQYSRNDAYVYARHAFSRFRLTARYAAASYDYEDTPLFGGGVLDQDIRDHDETVATGRVEVALTPRLALLAEASANTRDYDAPNRDSDGRIYSVGANFDITDLIRGEFTVGQFDQDYDDPALGDIKGTAYAAHVDWFPTQLTTVHGNALRGVEESSIAGATILHSEVGVRVDHELRRNIILSAGVRSGKREYRGVTRTDDTLSADLGADYLVNRRVRLHAGYTFDRNESDAPGEDFDVNRLYIGVSFHL